MKLATFTHDDVTRIGVVEGTTVVDLAAAAPELPTEMAAFLAAGEAAMVAARAAVGPRLALADVRLEAPVARPGKFLAVGVNYADHIAEMGLETPDFPNLFAKLATAINGPYDPVERPRVSDSLDYEAELGFVIAKRCRHVPRERAAEVLAGYVVVNDVSVREWQRMTDQVVMAKGFDTCCPYGPWIATAETVGDPGRLAVKCWVNGELRQDSNTAEMTFGCYELVEILSRAVTFEPGDVVATGTPPGVGAGFSPPKYLQPGDTVRIEIETIGHIENRVIAEPAERGEF